MKHRKSIIITILLVTLVVILSSVGLAARPQIIFWTSACCNNEEWISFKPDIDAKFNVDFKTIPVDQGAFIPKLKAAMADGNAPDIIEWTIENNRMLYTNPKKSLVLPLEKYTQKSEVFKHVIPGRVSYLTYGKHIYGLPHDAHPAILIYNDTLWREAGVDIAAIQTWDEFFAAAQKLRIPQNDENHENSAARRYALPHNGGLGGIMFMIWQQSGAQIIDKSGKPCFTSPRFRAFVEKWLSWYKSDTMCEWDWSNLVYQLKKGTLYSYISPDWYTSQVSFAARDGKYQFRARPLPLYAKGGPSTASWGGNFLAIVKTAKEPELLYKIIEYMQYNETRMNSRYRDTGLVAPVDTAWSNDESYGEPKPDFGGQKIGELQTSLAWKIPSVQTGDIFWDAINDFNEQYPDMAAGKISVAEGLKKAQEAAMKRYEELK
jgi:arabinosaccharide transport system substrate-binding protein